jgi:hypothetical protein
LLNFNKRFNTSYKQYVASFEGDFDNNNNDLKDAFGALLVDYDNKSSDDNKEEELDDFLAPSYFTLIESFLAEPLAIFYAIPYAKALVDNLNN